MKSRNKAVLQPDFEFERAHRAKGYACVGADEVGRGCLAGPVVAAAVQLPVAWLDTDEEAPWWSALNDSKLVKPAERERLAQLVHKHARVQIAWCTVEEIDRWNILHASLLAMRRALAAFRGSVGAVLVDGHLDPFDTRYVAKLPPYYGGGTFEHGFDSIVPIVKGDLRSRSIAAASIVAKVYRDRWMSELAGLFPGYGFEAHKGYSTPAHYQAISKLGPCALHRKSFAPFKSGSEDCSLLSDGEETLPGLVDD